MPEYERKEIDTMLDQLESYLLGMADSDDRARAVNIYNSIRDDYNAGMYDNKYNKLEMIIIKIKTSAELGFKRASLARLEKEVQQVHEDASNNLYSGMDSELLQKTLEVYSSDLDSIDFNNIEEASKKVLEVRKAVGELAIRSNLIEQKICNHAYEVVAKMFGEKAPDIRVKEFIEGLDLESDFQLFMKRKILSLVRTKTQNMSTGDMTSFVKYATNKEEIDPYDLSLWKSIAKVDKEIEIDTSPELQRNVAESLKEERYKVIIVRYDKSSPDGINKDDIQSLKKKLAKAEKSLIKGKFAIIFEEGVRKIPDLSNPEEDGISHSHIPGVGNRIYKMVFPSTIEEIEDYALADMPNLHDIDLSHTQIKVIPKGCFARSYVESVSLPDSLENVESYAFENTKTKIINFENTRVRKIGSYCFENSAVEKILFPSTLESIGISACNNTKNLEDADLSNTIIPEVPTACFLNSSIKSIILPRTTKEVGGLALAETDRLETFCIEKENEITFQKTWDDGVCDYVSPFLGSSIPLTDDGMQPKNIQILHPQSAGEKKMVPNSENDIKPDGEVGDKTSVEINE